MCDCVFSIRTKCEVLTEKNCEGCHFRKTREELQQGRAKATERIRSLPLNKQEHIRLKYYTRCRGEQNVND
jgi:hypothetical protein